MLFVVWKWRPNLSKWKTLGQVKLSNTSWGRMDHLFICNKRLKPSHFPVGIFFNCLLRNNNCNEQLLGANATVIRRYMLQMNRSRSAPSFSVYLPLMYRLLRSALKTLPESLSNSDNDGNKIVTWNVNSIYGVAKFIAVIRIMQSLCQILANFSGVK